MHDLRTVRALLGELSEGEGVSMNNAPSIEAAYKMGAGGGPTVEAERRAFEAWMRGHCWALCATWDGEQYRSDSEQGGNVCRHAMQTRMMWAAWRDRAALETNARTAHTKEQA